jgi:hypothetical protein
MFEIESALSFSEKKTIKFYGNDRTRMNKKLWILGRVCLSWMEGRNLQRKSSTLYQKYKIH